MKSATLPIVLLAAWLASGAAYASVEASVDSDQVAAGDTIELTLSHDGQTGSKPDLTPLNQDFDVLSTSRSSSVQIINGNYSSETRLRLTLSPKRSGQLTIPPLSWDNEQSPPIRITVGGNAQAGAAQTQSPNVFLKTTVDDSQPYVQGAVNLTVRLYAGVHLYRASLDLSASSDVLIQQLGKDRNSETEINGRRYEVVERHYLLFPQHSGALKIPGPVLDAQIPVRSRSDHFANDPFSDFFGQSPFGGMINSVKPVRIHADDIALEVRPRPTGATESYWIPARNLTVTSESHPGSLEARAGEPITLDLHLRAEGLTGAQLPDVVSLLRLPPGLKAYPDQAKLKNTLQNGTVVGERDQSVALIADRAGAFKLPAVDIQWWDTNADEPRTVELPARTLRVLPGAAGATPVPAANGAEPAAPAIELASGTSKSAIPSWRAAVRNRPWLWVSLTLVLLWLGTVLAWWLSRRRESKAPSAPRPAPGVRPSEARARDRFLAACKLNDPKTARRALLDWAQAKWPDSAFAGLRALANRIGDPNVDALLVELDRACFAGAQWNGAALGQALNRLPAAAKKKKAKNKELAELYP